MKKLQGGRDIFRETIRVRDKHTCRGCGKKWKEGQRRLDIHHKDLDSRKTKGELGCSNNQYSNLITLCHKCHCAEHKKHRADKNVLKPKNPLMKIFSEYGKKGGQATSKKFGGRDYFVELGKKSAAKRAAKKVEREALNNKN